MKKVGRNDPCPCGSGKKYKKCCLGKAGSKDYRNSGAPKQNELSLRDRNLILIDAIADIFGLSKCVEWEEVKRSISGDQIRQLYKVVAWLWPPDTDLTLLLPTPGPQLRALYLGDVRPEALVRNVYRFSLYADEILVVDPFHNPWCMAREYNPLENPDQYKADTLKLILFAGLMEPWVRADLALIVPDPGNFDYGLRRRTWELAQHRFKDIKLSREEIQDFEPSMKEDFARFVWTLPKEAIAEKLRQVNPAISDEKIDEVLTYIDLLRKRDPLALDQPIEKVGTQIMVTRGGVNLEMALYIAQITGAFPYTNLRIRWREILSVGSDLPETAKVWSPLTKAFQELEFKFLDNVDSRFACSLRTDGRLESFRAFLRRLWRAVGGEPDIQKIENIARDFGDELTDEYRKAEAEWAEIDRALLKWAGPTIAGGMVSGAFSLAIPALGFSVAAVVELIAARLKRREFRKKVPMSVFVDLSRH